MPKHQIERIVLTLSMLIGSCAVYMTAVAQTQEEVSLWNSVKDSKDPSDYQAYLDKYPSGAYAPLAHRRIQAVSASRSGELPTSAEGIAEGTKHGAATPLTLSECEETSKCGTWSFLGNQGNGQWPTGEVANLSVEHLNGDDIVIHRSDSTGASAGLTATYKGIRRGDRIKGQYTSAWPGHWDTKSGDWHATIGGPGAQTIPNVMHFCRQHCTTLIWDKDHFTNASDPGNAVWKVVQFTPDLVIIDRTDYRPYPGHAVYTAKMSSEQDSLIGPDWKITWGAALNSIPGADRPVMLVPAARPVVCVPWFFSIVCN